MEPNETYWNPDRKPAVRIIYDNATSKEEALRSVARGDGKIDVIMDLNVDEAKSFDGNGKGKLQTKAAKAVLVGLFNENKPNSPWRDPELRRAMTLALDRQMILDKGANGYGLVMPALIQPGRYGADPAMKPYKLDVQKALGTIEEANIPGKEITIFSGPDWKGVVEAIAECLARVGLNVKPIYGKEDPEDWDIKLVWHFD
jgi:peptide/nickel transport system substrate-binding protein